MHRVRSLRPTSIALVLVPWLAAPAWSAQTGVGGVTPLPGGAHQAPFNPPTVPGQELPKPGGGTFFVDPNQGGGASELHLVELLWGRLVDVHGLGPSGAVDPRPRFRDFVVNEAIQSDGVDYRLVQSFATQTSRLLILRQPGAPEPSPGAGTFETLLTRAASNLPPIVPKAENGFPPFSVAPRNAALVARFDDLLRDSPAATRDLVETVRVLTGTPPRVPFAARIVFDPNHGGLGRGRFHSTRVLVDLTVSELEAEELPVPLAVNVLGLPARPAGSSAPDVTLRIPTKTDPGVGQFVILTNLRNRGLSLTGNGPVDFGSPTLDVVRAFRSGNDEDPSAGFLLDLYPPALLGNFPVLVDAARPDPAGETGFAFLVDWTFTLRCGARPLLGDELGVGMRRLEVLASALPNPSGQVRDVALRLIGSNPATASELLGSGVFVTPLRSNALDPACWLAFSPAPSAAPPGGVSPAARVLVRFSEPMRATSIRPFDTLRIVRGDATQPADATSIVVADVQSSSELSSFALSPLLPLAHVQGTATPYHVELVGGLDGVVDLTGNPLAKNLPLVDFTLDAAAASEANGGIVLRFDGPDELEPLGLLDLRGEFFYDLSRSVIRPRPVAFRSYPVDRTNPVPSIMIPFPPGVQTPLAPLGSKLQTVWRYCDLGWSVRDETKYDLDVVGLDWAPVGGQVVADFYAQFEILLSHSARLPDEDLSAFLLPKYPNSGLLRAPHFYSENVLDDPLSPQKIVHPRTLGYSVNPANLFVSPTGTTLLPFPLNRGSGPLVTYTWRDTAALSKAGPSGAGIPLDVEVGPPLDLEPIAGELAPSGQVPTIGLPLLMEFKCFPSNTGLGLNALDVSLAINSSALPCFRVYSTGGINTAGLPVVKNPDLQLVPSGGFNPLSSPPGQPTPSGEGIFYIGQLDLVARVSRVHTVWIDSGTVSPDYLAPLVEATRPGASSVAIDMRGALGFAGAGTAPFDATRLDAYGELDTGSVLFLNGVASWTDDIDDVDGARYLQLRFSLVNDLATGQSPELASLAVAFAE